MLKFKLLEIRLNLITLNYINFKVDSLMTEIEELATKQGEEEAKKLKNDEEINFLKVDDLTKNERKINFNQHI